MYNASIVSALLRFEFEEGFFCGLIDYGKMEMLKIRR